MVVLNSHQAFKTWYTYYLAIITTQLNITEFDWSNPAKHNDFTDFLYFKEVSNIDQNQLSRTTISKTWCDGQKWILDPESVVKN